MGIPDDTVAIQKAIDAAHTSGTGLSHQRVYFPYGDYVVSSLNATRRQSLRLEGDTMLGSRLLPIAQKTPAPVIDATSSCYFEMDRLTIWALHPDTSNAPDVHPTVGVLIASMQENTGSSTKCNLSHLWVAGFFSKAAVYIFGSTNNSFFDTSFHAYNDGVPALVMTGSNTINGEPNYVTSPYIELPQHPLVYTSDATFIQAEVHTLILDPRPTPGEDRFIRVQPRKPNTHPIIIENASGFRFYGGVISSDGESLVDLRGKTDQVTFDGTTFESESGLPPDATVRNRGGLASGLALRNTIINNGAAGDGAIVHGTPGAVFSGLTIEGSIGSLLGTKAKMIHIENHPNPATQVIVNSRIAAEGREMIIGGSIGSTLITQPGKYSIAPGATDTSLKIE